MATAGRKKADGYAISYCFSQRRPVTYFVVDRVLGSRLSSPPVVKTQVLLPWKNHVGTWKEKLSCRRSQCLAQLKGTLGTNK